jgi:hypothetical protein
MFSSSASTVQGSFSMKTPSPVDARAGRADVGAARLGRSGAPARARKQCVSKTVRGATRLAHRELARTVAGGDRRTPTAALTVGKVLERW